MGRIRQLDAAVIARIAAGEVVERPASVVKELAENSIDAGARNITIEINRGGFGLIRVRDDGVGIAPDDLPLALARHATSKLDDADDLYAVRTLGFRGEALSSIGAVAQVELLSRTPDRDGGWVHRVEGGATIHDGASASPPGTTVSVANLFFNTPARLAFQRSHAAEARAIAQIVTHLALAAPTIRWQLVIDGHQSISTTGDGSLLEVAIAVYGAVVAPHLLTLPLIDETAVHIAGICTSPVVHRNTRTYTTFVVNGRVVRSQALTHAVEEAYHALLPTGRHPIASVRIDVPPAEVDVNIHPTKLEIRLQRERLVYARVRDAVLQAVGTFTPSPVIQPSAPSWPPYSSTHTPTPPTTGTWGLRPTPLLDQPGSNSAAEAIGLRRASTLGGEASPREQSGSAWSAVLAASQDAGIVPLAPKASPGSDAAPKPTGQAARPASDPATWRPLGQVGLTYIVVESPDGMYLIDQHSAHERIVYQQLKLTPTADEILIQPLLNPDPIELTPSQSTWLRTNVAFLQSFGYDLEPFGKGTGTETWLLRAVPRTVATRGRARALADLLDALIDREYGDGPVEDQTRWAVACHSAVRAGDTLTMTEMVALLDQLSRCDLRQTCPHGRPTMIHLSHTQLAREFGR
ncbi:MAG: DNA mismatch repair endonuclease MutL [Chloroflexi bacterium]|nr:DNA mismatch repair endonuclease MutL [Chloroflexota bacterium]